MWVHRGSIRQWRGRCLTLDVDWGDAAGLAPVSERCRRAVIDHPAIVAAALGPAVAAALGDVLGDDVRGDRALARTIPRLAVLLQRTMGHDLPDPPDGPEGGLPMLVPIWDEEIGKMAAHTAVLVLGAARGGLSDEAAVVTRMINRYVAAVRRHDHAESVRRLIEAADRRRIPWSRLIARSTIVRFGDGARQVRIDGAALTSTGKIPDTVSIRKYLANALLRQHGVPVPRQHLVRSLDAARAAAAAIGFPGVVKPSGTNYGIEVRTGIADDASLRHAVAAAAAHGSVLIEQQIPGDHTRLLVFQGRFLSAVRQDPAQVVGDGRQTVAALIAAVNAGRTEVLSSQFQRIAIDDEAHELLAQQGLAIDAVPVEGRRVRLRHGSNTSRGGTAWNVTPRVHPDNARLAERATQVLGLDIAGVDLITPDVERSFREVGGMICEINSGPGLYMREPDDRIEETILDGLFPGDRPGRVPIVSVLGEEDGPTAALVARIAARLASGRGGIAVVRPSRIEIGGWVFVDPPARLHDAAAMALADPQTRAAVIQLPARAVLEDGLAFARCDLAVVAATAADAPEASERRQAADLLTASADGRVDPAREDLLDAALDRLSALAAV